MGIKQEIYDWLVRKNENVQREYERYVIEHLEEHYTNRMKHWSILWKLNWHYRILNNKDFVLYPNDSAETLQRDIIKNEKKTPKKVKGRKDVGFIIKNNAGNYVDVSWKKIEGVVFYNVYFSEDKEQYKFAYKGNGNSCRIRNLRHDTQYYIKIKYSLNGENYKDDLSIMPVKTKKLNKYEQIFGIKELYSDGAESEYKKRMSAMNIAKGLMRYDVISFDIFDTLLLRPFTFT